MIAICSYSVGQTPHPPLFKHASLMFNRKLGPILGKVKPSLHLERHKVQTYPTFGWIFPDYIIPFWTHFAALRSEVFACNQSQIFIFCCSACEEEYGTVVRHFFRRLQNGVERHAPSVRESYCRRPQVMNGVLQLRDLHRFVHWANT